MSVTVPRWGADVGLERLERLTPERVQVLRRAIVWALRAEGGPLNVAHLPGAMQHVAGIGRPDPQDVVAVRNLLEREGVLRRFEDRTAHRAAGSPGSWWFVDLVDREEQSVGTRPEDMRYRIERDAVSGIPWLVIERDSVWEWYAPVHELRVAWQHHDWWKAQCARASALIAEPGNRVVAVGADRGDVRAAGEAVGYADFVQVVIRTDDGSQLFWAADLTHPAAAYASERVAGESDVAGGAEDHPALDAARHGVEAAGRWQERNDRG
jgi:hypothetical protein